MAYVAIRLTFPSHNSGRASGTGALATFSDDTLGKAVLIAMAAGFAALVLWQLISAAVGYGHLCGWRRHLNRFGAVWRAASYGYLGFYSAKFALQGPSAKSGSPDSTTAKVLHWPAGTFLLLAVALIAAGSGVGQFVQGYTRRFLEQLDDEANNQERRIPIALVGQVGYAAKGLAFLTIGVLFGWIAVTHDPKKSGGLDQALFRLLGGGLGRPAIILIGVGIGIFGVYALIWSRHLGEEMLTR